MMILRMSVFVLSITFSASAFSQADQQSTYQCSSGTSLSDGYLTYKTKHILAIAKHKDGTISEISGMLGQLQPNQDYSDFANSLPTFTYAQVARMAAEFQQMEENRNKPVQGGMMSMGMGMGLGKGMGMGFMGNGVQIRDVGNGAFIIHFDSATADEAPDRDDIEKTPTRYVERKPGDAAGLKAGDFAMSNARPGDHVARRPGDQVQQRPGDRVATRTGDSAPALLTASIQAKKPIQPKIGDLVMKPNAIVYSAKLDSQGNISEITYRDGKRPTTVWRAKSNNPESTNSVYTQLNSELNNIKARAYCCTKNPGANCGTNLDQTGAQYSLRSEKPTIGQKLQNAWSDMINAFKTTSTNEAK